MGKIFFLFFHTILLTIAVSSWWTYHDNTLFRNGRWTVIKDTGKYVYQTYEFMSKPITEARIDLSANMGFQGIMYKKHEGPKRRLVKLKVKVLISPKGYLWVVLKGLGQQMLSFRLSRNDMYASGFYRYKDNGELLDYLPFEREIFFTEKKWRTLETRLIDKKWRITVDGKHIGSIADMDLKGSTFGFRGCSNASTVFIKDIDMGFRDPADPTETWIEYEDFSPKSARKRIFWFVAIFTSISFCLRFWRQNILERFLSYDLRSTFFWVDNIGITILLLLLVFSPQFASGILIPLFILVGEILVVITFTFLLKDSRKVSQNQKLFSGVAYSCILVLIIGAAIAKHGEWIGRERRLKEHYHDIHPGIFSTSPQKHISPQPLLIDTPVVISPGNPFFTEGKLYREQSIITDFVIPTRTTLDVVFQQQSLLRHGDQKGEEIPFQRRLFRISTRKEVATGLATRTGTRLFPLVRVNGTARPNADNHLEIRSGPEGVEIVLNDKKTFIPQIKVLGYGETGFMVFEKAVKFKNIRIEPSLSESMKKTFLPLLYAILPIVLALSIWSLLRSRGAASFADIVSLVFSALYPLAFYLIGTLMLETNELVFLDRNRLAWLDLMLAASALSHLNILVIFRHKLKFGALYFNFFLIIALFFFFLFVWDKLLPPSHPLRLKFTQEAIAPGDFIHPGKSGPWYNSNQQITANTYVWKQRFGGEQISVQKRKNRTRIFIVGGSQAWGSGAASSMETFAELLEGKLRSNGVPVEIFNAGVNGSGIGMSLLISRKLLPQFNPDIIIADIGTNDSGGTRTIKGEKKRKRHIRMLIAEFDRLVRFWQKKDTEVVLVLEPTSGETSHLFSSYPKFYEKLETVAEKHGVVVLKPQPMLREKERDHFIWWDLAHLAPYGHQLMAAFLEPAIEQLVRARPGDLNRNSDRIPRSLLKRSEDHVSRSYRVSERTLK